MGNDKQTMTAEISREQLLEDLRRAYEGGASIRSLSASTGRSYGTIHSMLRESGAVMRGRGGPNHVRSH
jgi:autotransporter adhesin